MTRLDALTFALLAVGLAVAVVAILTSELPPLPVMPLPYLPV
jgi:hypothetical protein